MNRHSTSEQLTLLPAVELPLQFRIDEATRRRGLRHIAEIRQLLAERHRSRTTGEITGEVTEREHRTAA